MKTKKKFGRFGATAALTLAVVGSTIGIASAQSSSSTTPSTAAGTTVPSGAKSTDSGAGARRGGGFNVHADTIAKALGITTAELQTELSSGKTVAQIASAKGVSLQTVIDAYVAEEMAEHPELTKADVVARVTDRVNGVRPQRGPSTPPAPPATGTSAPAASNSNGTAASTTA
jgi:hypothetical protein